MPGTVAAPGSAYRIGGSGNTAQYMDGPCGKASFGSVTGVALVAPATASTSAVDVILTVDSMYNTVRTLTVNSGTHVAVRGLVGGGARRWAS